MPELMENDSRTIKFPKTRRPVKRGPVEIWESEATRPKFEGAGTEGMAALKELAADHLPDCLKHPFRSKEHIQRQQFERLQYLVDLAYREVPLYTRKYDAVGFKPEHLRTWKDYERIPVITKSDLMDADPMDRLTRRWAPESLFSTRTFGSSGRTLMLKVNRDAILLDTVQGVRQFWLQSGMKYSRDHLTAMVYTVPWWFPSIGDEFPSAFISGLIAPSKVSEHLRDLRPEVLSLYPTNLKALLPYKDAFRKNLHLAVVHSEGSTAAERHEWSRELGVPVLDEYSSEESTRIALELPCGHYHVCEDTVRLEVINPETQQPCPDGETGLAVVTNLLNEAMPFIRYVQGDYVTRPRCPGKCLVGWSQLESIDGRMNDSFVNHDGQVVPAGTMLDLAYRWMFDVGINVREFELVQQAPDLVRAILMLDEGVSAAKGGASLAHLEELLELCLGHAVRVEADFVTKFPTRPGKKRPIRRAFTPAP